MPDCDLKALSHLAHSPDGRTFLIRQTDGTAQVCDAATMQPLGPPLRHEYAILSVAISPDGTRLLTGCVDGTVHAWSARTRQPIGRPLRHQGPVHSVAFSPDGRMVLTGSGDRTARLWDAATGKPIGMPLTHNAGVVAVAFSGPGDAVLTTTEDGIVRRWDRAADASGPDERFVLWAQVAIGAEIDANGTVRGIDAQAWHEKWDRLRAWVASRDLGTLARRSENMIGLSTREGAENVPRPIVHPDTAGRTRAVTLALPGGRRPGLLAGPTGLERRGPARRPSREVACPPGDWRPETAGRTVVLPHVSGIRTSVTRCSPRVPMARYPRAVINGTVVAR